MRFLKRSSSVLIVFIAAAWLFQSPAFACASDTCAVRGVEEPTIRLAGDFDGDHQIDRVSGRIRGSSYSIDVRLSTRQPRVRLTVPVRNEVGLELISVDVNRDRRADLIVMSASSVAPIAVWLNTGNGAFERSSQSFAPLFGDGHTPRLQRGTGKSYAQGALATDDSPDAFEPAENLAFRLEGGLFHRHPDQSPLPVSACGAASPRGPPLSLL
jgi:hypothetical protein